MANLPNDLEKLQIEETSAEQPVSESVIQKAGKSINGLIDRFNSRIEFTAPNSTWVVPSDCYQVYILGIGGGGGGGNGLVGIDGSNQSSGGGGGGAAATLSGQFRKVTPGNTLNIYVGAGGTAGVNGGNSYITGLDEIDTLFFPGAERGQNGQYGAGGAGGENHSIGDVNQYSSPNPGGDGAPPQFTPTISGETITITSFYGGTVVGAAGGTSGIGSGGGNGGGGGGGGGTSSFGIGGAGGNGSNNPIHLPGATAGADAPSTHYGAGGGGGGGGSEAGSRAGGAGGKGANGWIAILFSGG